MALGDYILCCECECKLIYDGDRDKREWWHDRWGKEPQIKCPDCETPQRQPLMDERLELIGHADLAINNIYIFNGYGEEVPEGRTPIYAGYKAAHGIYAPTERKGEV